MRKLLLLALVLVLLPVACGGGPKAGKRGMRGHGGRGGGGEDGEDEGPQTDPRTLVEAETAVTGAVSQYVVSSAVVESEAAIALLPETSGLVTAVNVEEGDEVHQGQVLATIENPNLDATLDRARAAAERAEQSYGELERLHAAGALSDRELLDAQHALATARTTYEEAQRMGAFSRLVSPIDGRVAARNVKFGQLVSPAVPAFELVDLDRLRVVVQLPERDLTRVAPGQLAHLVPVYDESILVPGHVERLAPVVDPTTGTFRVTVVPDDPEAGLRPGQFASVRIQTDLHEGVLTIPRRALLYDRGEPYVFRVQEAAAEEEEEKDEEKKEEEGFLAKARAKFAELKAKLPGQGGEDEEEDEELPGPRREARKVPVELGFMEVATAEILGGLAEGDLVVTLGQEVLRDEARVRLPGDPTLEDIAKEKEEKEKAEKDAAEGEAKEAEAAEGDAKAEGQGG